MRVCLLTCNPRHSAAGDRIAAIAERLGDATVVTTRGDEWPGAVHIDELTGAFDAALAIGWQACLHVFRPSAETYAYYVPALQDALLWHGDERRLLAALTYDLPLTLIAPNRGVAQVLRERAPGRRIVVVEPGIARPPDQNAPGNGPLRIAGAPDDVLARMTEPFVNAGDAADVQVELAAGEAPLLHVPRAMLAGAVPVVTPAFGHDELISDGENGIVVGFDDVPGIARVLDTLARDRELLSRLREGALRRAESLPTLDDEAKALADTLREGAAPEAWPARLLLNARAVAEPIAQERRALDQVLREQEQRIVELNAENERLTIKLERQAPAYRVGKKLEPLWKPLQKLRRRG